MSHKAWMRAVRETCGISQHDLAKVAGVEPLTVKRWERQGETEPPEHVLAYLARELEAHDAYVTEMVESLAGSLRGGGRALVDIYRTQADSDREYERTGEEPIPYRRWNACNIDAANRLRQLGIEVVWRYPDEEMLSREVG